MRRCEGRCKGACGDSASSEAKTAVAVDSRKRGGIGNWNSRRSRFDAESKQASACRLARDSPGQCLAIRGKHRRPATNFQPCADRPNGQGRPGFWRRGERDKKREQHFAKCPPRLAEITAFGTKGRVGGSCPSV